jgi:hypothetical protein
VKALVLMAGLLCIGGSLQAQTVYRCGPDGRVYSQSPCPQGRAVDVSDERSATQRAAAQARARDNQVRGDALERERLDREAGKPAVPGNIGGSAAPVTEPVASKSKSKSKASRKKKPKTEQASDDFKAIAPAPAKKAKSRS